MENNQEQLFEDHLNPDFELDETVIPPEDSTQEPQEEPDPEDYELEE